MNECKEQNMKTTETIDERRLWIGNLDPRITGQPRGYAFVTYKNKGDALRAKNLLHNKLVGSKNIIVTWAHSISAEETEKQKPEIKIPALSMSKPEPKVNKQIQIQAIEAKLKLMAGKSSQDDLEINKTVASETPIITQYQFNKQQSNNGSSSSSSNIKSKSNYKKLDRHKPYNKTKTRR